MGVKLLSKNYTTQEEINARKLGPAPLAKFHSKIAIFWLEKNLLVHELLY